MSLFVYRGVTTDIEVVKSKRLQIGLSRTLGVEVQPLQIRSKLTHFLDLAEPRKWHQVCEIDEGKTFDNMVGEYICGVITSQLTPKDTQVEIVTPTGYCTTLDTALTYQIDWVIDDLELSAKLRRKDGLHLRTAPPDNPLSRRVWRLDNALMIQTLVQEVNDSVTVSTSPLIKTRKVMSSV